MKLFYSLKRKVLAVCLAGMLLMALCMGGISIWTISHLTHDYELQNMNHIVDGKTADMNDELLRSENIVDYATHSVEREITDTRLLRDPAFQRNVARLVDNDFQDAVPGLSLICSYYLYYPSENVSIFLHDRAGTGRLARAVLFRGLAALYHLLRMPCL